METFYNGDGLTVSLKDIGKKGIGDLTDNITKQVGGLTKNITDKAGNEVQKKVDEVISTGDAGTPGTPESTPPPVTAPVVAPLDINAPIVTIPNVDKGTQDTIFKVLLICGIAISIGYLSVIAKNIKN